MTKIEELLETIERYQHTPEPIDTYGYFDIVKIMKEYAEWYAQKCLEIAAEHAQSITDIDEYIYGSIVDKNTILNIKFPDHD